MDLFRVRLNCIDHYQSNPSQFDPILRNNVAPSQVGKEPKVPVIRVFGATETGQKVCAHIHGAFPYLYIEYTGSLSQDDVGAYIHRLHLSIDYALAVSYRRNMYDGNAKFVARITLVKGVPFYGFHVGYQYYLKIYMLNPMNMTRLADLLRQGVVMKRVFQPYEAHLQYLLQWMADYNLYGCGYINCQKVTFRSPVPQFEEQNSLSHFWHDRSIPEALVIGNSVLPRVSHCSIEVDICVQDILNRQDVKPRHIHHDFIERANPLAPDGKLVPSMAGLWRDETRRRKSRMTNPEPGSSPFPADVLISMSADPRYSQPGGWIHEEEYRDKVMSLIQEENNNSDGAKISYKTFVKPNPLDYLVRTSLESAEDLYPENLRAALGLNPPPGTIGVSYNPDDNGAREVDEKLVLGFANDEDDTTYDSDEEIMKEINISQNRDGDMVRQRDLDPANQQKPKHEIGDKSCSSGDPTQKQFPDSSDFTSSADDSHGPISAVKGGEFTSNLIDPAGIEPSKTGTTIRMNGLHKRSESPVCLPALSVKRQRVSLSQEEEAKSVLRNSEGLKSGHVGQAALEPLSTGVVEQDVRPPQTKATKTKPPTVNGSFRKAMNTGRRPSSQEVLKGIEKPQSQPLGFPVVKDPFEPSTFLRLSQKELSQPTSSSKIQHTSVNSILSSSQSHNFGRTLAVSESRSSSGYPSDPVLKVLRNMEVEFRKNNKRIILAIKEQPPSAISVVSTMQDFGLPPVIYQDAFYSDELDVPDRPRQWAGREFKLESLTVPFLPEFDPTGTSYAVRGEKSKSLPDKAKEERNYQRQRAKCSLRSWVIAEPPPTYSEVSRWALQHPIEPSSNATKLGQSNRVTNNTTKARLSQVEGPTQKNSNSLTNNQKKDVDPGQEAQYMSTLSLEVHVNTRRNLVPNPEEDEVQCLFWCLQTDEEGAEGFQCDGITGILKTGIVVLSEDGRMAQKVARQSGHDVQEESSELDLMIRMVEIVRTLDPDILTGYEVHGGSWGYLIERARLKYEYNLCDELSRMKTQSHGRFGKENDKWGFNHTSTIRITGRHMINIWRAMRSELNLLQYTMENVAFNILHRRIPHFAWADLTRWYTNGKPRDLAKVVDYYVSRVQLDLEILEKNELIPRTSEQARLLGVDFFSVFSRGSQFKVESLMFRIAKPENFMLVSPSRKQVGGQNALECLPLVMEPQSAFYNSPLLVLDFQSLYPSIMIAYNYCYSTFLGRIVNWRGTNKMGFTEFKRQQRLLELLKDQINISPNGMMYVKPEIRRSLLAKMLGEILETRVMVKSGMKVDKDNKAIQRLLNNRQLALKLIANVTYGYTSASFSGRMPCSEIADSIVQTARETLEKSIALIHSVKRWGAEVVYGDTDSLFVYLKGRTKDQAFDIGEEIAKTITNMNPRPVKLKFEKVYHPCVLLAKKRYVGFKYEHRNQVEPDFDAKGIETVRRDGTPAEQKIEEKALKILFRTSDLSQVKSYFQRECEKIMKGSISIQDFCFAKEVRLGTYSDKGPPPPGALISTRRMLEDARAEPQYGERVPYVVITGAPGARLIDRCVAPEELLENETSELDSEYYISKNLIPPLERIFNLVGANVRNWYDEMPKVQRIRRVDANLQLLGQSKDLMGKTLESYLKTSLCLVCKEKLEFEAAICPQCFADKPVSVLSLRQRLNTAERNALNLQKVCQSCSGQSPLDEVKCDSKDCPVFYTRTKQSAHLKREKAIVEPVMKELSGCIVTMDDLDW